MLHLSLGAPAVGLLLAVATFAQISAGLMQARKGGTGMTQNLRVICSSLMVTVSSVLIDLAMASSATPNASARLTSCCTAVGYSNLCAL
jgi:hypothetical protein